MEGRYIIDTNIVIYYLDNQIPAKEISKVNDIFRESFNISTVSVIELLGWHKLNAQDMQKLEIFLANAEVHFVDFEIQQKAIDIKQLRKTPTPDSIIAATALLNGYTVVTRNVSDFSKIAGLKVYNPFEEN